MDSEADPTDEPFADAAVTTFVDETQLAELSVLIFHAFHVVAAVTSLAVVVSSALFVKLGTAVFGKGFAS